MGFLVFLIVLGTVLSVLYAASERARRLRQAERAYRDSLAQLKRKPTNPDLKQQTLALGRAYSNLTRNSRGVSLFDEVALANDINAACAAASVPQMAYAAQPGPAASLESRLSRLTDLKDRGLVTEEEYTAERRRILAEI